ncbi:membrane protein [Mycobacterium pseudoshottsii JCM 15466]|nr:membrane protein [Mycobacterium pseudoshottsii JCM 15466]
MPDVDHETWHTLPRATRLQVVTRHWAEHGFGTPYAVYLLYLLKIGIYVAAPAAIISLTPGLGGLGHIADWWTQPIVYQKVIIFTLLFEVLGFGCGSGPLTGRFMPPVGGFLYWLRPKTIRLPPWPAKVPFTDGDTRTVVDVTLYAIVLISGGWALFSPGHAGQVTASGDVGLIDPILVVPTIIALALLGLRDKTVFLAARGEHYWLKLFVFFFPFTDQIAAFKIIMLCLWWGAATSKLNHHFPYVVAVMTSNNALLRGRLFNPIKHLLYRDHVNDLRPSWLPKIMAHVGGTTAEFLVPAVLVLVAGDQPWRWFLIGFMVIFHLNILSNLPMGVPLEWNVFFIFSLFYLFGHYGSIRAIDLRSPLLLAIVLAAVAVVVARNLFPEKISFLPAMRYYAGNWATSVWCFRAGAEEKIEASVVKSSALVVNQLAKLYDANTAEIMADKTAAFRAMHTHGRALNGLLPRAIGNEAEYKVREGEIVAGPLVGWNFGEGHLHNEQLVQAVQRRCNFADGDLRVIILEGQPIHIQKQWYRIVDAKTGLIEAGYVTVEDMLAPQPWPEPGDEFPVHVTTQRAAQ